MRGDFLVDYEGVSDDIVNIRMMCRLSFSKMLIWVGCVSYLQKRCVCVCVSVYIYSVLENKGWIASQLVIGWLEE